jgi:hypothetical protein
MWVSLFLLDIDQINHLLLRKTRFQPSYDLEGKTGMIRKPNLNDVDFQVDLCNTQHP